MKSKLETKKTVIELLNFPENREKLISLVTTVINNLDSVNVCDQIDKMDLLSYTLVAGLVEKIKKEIIK